MLGHQHLDQVQYLWPGLGGVGSAHVGVCAEGGEGQGAGSLPAHPDLEGPPERFLLLLLVLFISPGLDAQLLLGKEAGEVLVQGHHGLIP